MSQKMAMSIMVGMALLMAALSISVGVAMGQERPTRATRQWQLGELPQEGWKFPNVRIDVFDTEGVCIYVTRTYTPKAEVSATLTAVPKTQLPKGTGCQ